MVFTFNYKEFKDHISEIIDSVSDISELPYFKTHGYEREQLNIIKTDLEHFGVITTLTINPVTISLSEDEIDKLNYIRKKIVNLKNYTKGAVR